MTADILPAHKALIEAALAWHAAGEGPATGGDWRTVVSPRLDRQLSATEALDAAVLALRALDPTGSTLARWAAIGEAVERLIAEFGTPKPPVIQMRPLVWDDRIEWLVRAEAVKAGTKQAYMRLVGTGPTISAAISAALGEP